MTYGLCFICVYSLYADNCLLYRKIDSGSDCEMLQNDLMNLELWPRKCLILMWRSVKLYTSLISNSYALYGRHLRQVVKYL